MARKLRVEYAGAIYHLMNRGDRREPIFRDDKDRERFLETLGERAQESVRNMDRFGHPTDVAPVVAFLLQTKPPGSGVPTSPPTVGWAVIWISSRSGWPNPSGRTPGPPSSTGPG